jgi:hypothetical protein
MCQAPVAHTCNPSYLGGRDQDAGEVQSQPRQIVLQDPILKNPSQK